MRLKIARREKIINAADYDNKWKDGIESALTNSLVTQDIKRGGKIDESFEAAAKHAGGGATHHDIKDGWDEGCLLYTSPSPRDS